VLLAPCVKGNGYGHGLVLSARAFLSGSADWLCVNAVYEAQRLRDAGIAAPIYVLGYVGQGELAQALRLGCRLVVYNHETVEASSRVAVRLNLRARLHLKVETGNNRQGVKLEEALMMARRIASLEGVELEGVASHFANIEDTTDHRYAKSQFERFGVFCRALEREGIRPPLRHMANSAAAMLMPDTQLELVRSGLSAYGMWPSKETLLSAQLAERPMLGLEPSLTWTCRVAQLKEVEPGEFVGYGCTFRTTHRTKLAILPVGYYDGYPRALSNSAHVLIDGRRAEVRGRVCMNIIMVDVTDIPGVTLESEAVLLGQSGEERITAEQFAEWAGTINYEVTTRINDRILRVVDKEGESASV